jgi:hypothetical protein
VATLWLDVCIYAEIDQSVAVVCWYNSKLCRLQNSAETNFKGASLDAVFR